jgi:RNA polymerase sigma factor (sigma-70 family)
MNLREPEILQALMKSRTRLSAAAWVVVRDTHAAEDIFQNVALKAMTREVSFESEGALLSWAFIAARHEGIDWLRRHRREALGLGEEILVLLEQDWQAESSQPSGARIDALRECLAAAPQSTRQLLRLRYFDGYALTIQEDAGLEIHHIELGPGRSPR